MMRTALDRRGYKVLDVANGIDALRLLDHYRGPIDLLLTDVLMPGMNGRELFEQLANRRPGLKVLFVSGYTGEDFREASNLELDAPFLPKPFRLEVLLQKVREVLDNE